MPNVIKLRRKPWFQFTIVGAGANGSHFFRGLCQDLRTHINAFKGYDNPFSYQHIMLIDGDHVQEKNLGNQLFSRDEVSEAKVEALAERYGEHYNLEVLYHASFIKDESELSRLMPVEYSSQSEFIPVLIGMVDNNQTRQLLDSYFRSDRIETMIYIDAGVHSVEKDDKGNLRPDTGNNGQVVVGFKYRGEICLEPVGGVYPNVMTDQDSPAPGCGVVVQSQPQRLTTNKFTAQIANNIVNSLLAEKSIFVHQVTFDARMCGARPTFITNDQAAMFEKVCE